MPVSEADTKTIASVTASHISLAGCDAKAICRKLSERRTFLFSKDHDEAEVWVAGDGAGEFQGSFAKTLESVSSFNSTEPGVRKRELRLLANTGPRSEADASRLPVLKEDAF